jgi:hypothetical protein
MRKRIKLYERNCIEIPKCPQNNVTIFDCVLMVSYRMLIAEEYSSKQR